MRPVGLTLQKMAIYCRCNHHDTYRAYVSFPDISKLIQLEQVANHSLSKWLFRVSGCSLAEEATIPHRN